VAQSEVKKLILVAYECRGRCCVTLAAPEPQLLDNATADSTDTAVNDRTQVSFAAVTSEMTVLPSDLLSNDEWVRNTINLFSLVGISSTTVSQELKDKADNLATILERRIRLHKEQKIKQESKRTHWSMKFASKNLAANAALMILCDQVKKQAFEVHDRRGHAALI